MNINASIVLLALLTLSLSCKPKVSIPGGTIEQNGEQITMRTGDGGTLVAGGNVKLPEGFPTDVPKPSGHLEMAMKMGLGYNVAFICQENPSDLFAKMQAEFKTEGWAEVMAMQQGTGGMLGFQKDGNRHVQCTIAQNKKGQTVVNMNVQKRPQ